MIESSDQRIKFSNYRLSWVAQLRYFLKTGKWVKEITYPQIVNPGEPGYDNCNLVVRRREVLKVYLEK